MRPMKSRPHLLIWSANSVELFYLEPSQCCSTRQRACPRRLSESRANSRKLSEFHRQLAIATLVTRIFSATDLHRSNTDSAEAHLFDLCSSVARQFSSSNTTQCAAATKQTRRRLHARWIGRSADDPPPPDAALIELRIRCLL